MDPGELEFITQGAEAQLYMTIFLGFKSIVKYRVPKPYRHPDFDKLFRYRRTLIEARIMSHLKILGLNVPAIYFADPDHGLIIMEYIDGHRLSDCLSELSRDDIIRYALSLGRQTSIMHKNTIYHGDLTIANTIIANDKLYIIDFGLAGYSRDLEEYAIDIHLLSRSIEALYPELHDLFMEYFWKGYMEIAGKEFTAKLKDKVRDIRLRGRYVEERLRRKISRERYM
ncbi:MAG: Kae1-associated kinase Bud32 [Thermoprotei archaeon]|nr:MAG: Kae1-associated kinase Bud32 [Thermoprotei archaeon]